MVFNFGEWDGNPLTPDEKAQGYYVSFGYKRRAVMVRWYFCPPGARDLGFATIYASSIWTDSYSNCLQDLGEIPLGWVNKVTGVRLDNQPNPKWNNGRPPLGVTGQHPCGRPEWFLGPVPDGGGRRGPGGLPVCCNPALGAAIGLGRGRPALASGAAFGLGRLNVQAALGLLGRAPAAAELGVGASPIAVAAGLALAALDAPAGPLAVSALPTASAPVVLGPPAAANGIEFARGDVFIDWSVLLGFLGGGNTQYDLHVLLAVATVNGTAVLSQCRWYHVGIVYDGVNLIGYTDANPDGSTAAAGLLVPNGTGIFWSSLGGGLYGSGDWSEVRVYAAALTPAEIVADAQGTVQAGITAQYPCNDGAGVTVTDVIGGANGTLVNGPVWIADGPGGGAIRFDAALSQYVAAPDTIGNIPPFTVTLWYRPPRS